MTAAVVVSIPLFVIIARLGWQDTYQGLIVPIVVNSGSMADVLLGPHRDVTCAACGRRFACGIELLPASGRGVCPNCGSQTGNLDSARDRAGDRLLIDREAFQLRDQLKDDAGFLRVAQETERRSVN